MNTGLITCQAPHRSDSLQDITISVHGLRLDDNLTRNSGSQSTSGRIQNSNEGVRVRLVATQEMGFGQTQQTPLDSLLEPNHCPNLCTPYACLGGHLVVAIMHDLHVDFLAIEVLGRSQRYRVPWYIIISYIVKINIFSLFSQKFYQNISEDQEWLAHFPQLHIVVQ